MSPMRKIGNSEQFKELGADRGPQSGSPLWVVVATFDGTYVVASIKSLLNLIAPGLLIELQQALTSLARASPS